MNYLAHAYLSFYKPGILVGNMISDYVKGKKKYEFEEEVQKGIALHRAIDNFTDTHAATRAAKEYLKPAAGAYSGPFIDVVYDHFLANDDSELTETSLQHVATNTYEVLYQFQHVLPDRFRLMLPYMSSQNWLYNYRNMWGAERSFEGLARRAKYIDESDKVFLLFQQHYASLQNCYKTFFPAVKQFSVRFIEGL